MKILSIETSCDDTAISIMGVTGGMTNASFKVLANVSNSQINIHIPYGGVYPVLAKREHAKNLPILLEQTLKQAKLSTVDVVAVTYGPGLEMCLWGGHHFCKRISKKVVRRPAECHSIIPVNHMEGHIFLLLEKTKEDSKIPKVAFPMLSLLVSGEHTQLVLSKNGCNMKLLVRHWTMQSVRLSTKWLECSAFPILEVGDFKTSRRRKSQRKRIFAGTSQRIRKFFRSSDLRVPPPGQTIQNLLILLMPKSFFPPHAS